jgi:hypothetical protein
VLVPIAFAQKLTVLGHHHSLDHQSNPILLISFPFQNTLLEIQKLLEIIGKN